MVFLKLFYTTWNDSDNDQCQHPKYVKKREFWLRHWIEKCKYICFHLKFEDILRLREINEHWETKITIVIPILSILLNYIDKATHPQNEIHQITIVYSHFKGFSFVLIFVQKLLTLFLEERRYANIIKSDCHHINAFYYKYFDGKYALASVSSSSSFILALGIDNKSNKTSWRSVESKTKNNSIFIRAQEELLIPFGAYRYLISSITLVHPPRSNWKL